MTSLKLLWKSLSRGKDDLIEILGWGWIMRRTPLRKNSLLFYNPSSGPTDSISIRVDNVPDEIIQQLLQEKKRYKRSAHR